MPTHKFFRHPRFLATLEHLREAGCQINQYTLFGHFDKLEEWVTDNHITGDLTGVSDDMLEAAVGWLDEPRKWRGMLAAALHKSGLIVTENGAMRLRGWPDCANHAVKMRIRRMAERNMTPPHGHENAVRYHNGARRAPECAHRSPTESGGLLEGRGGEERGGNTNTAPRAQLELLKEGAASGCAAASQRKPKAKPPTEKHGWSAACAAMTGDALRTPAFEAAWLDWEAYRRETRKPITGRTITAQIRKLEAMGPEDAVASIRRSIEHGWQGLFEPESDPPPRAARGRDPRPGRIVENLVPPDYPGFEQPKASVAQ